MMMNNYMDNMRVNYNHIAKQESVRGLAVIERGVPERRIAIEIQFGNKHKPLAGIVVIIIIVDSPLTLQVGPHYIFSSHSIYNSRNSLLQSF